MKDFVNFHRALTRGAKRAMPRAVRFVYMELSLEARELAGTIVLPGNVDVVRAVHDLIGGDKREITEALRWLTTPETDSDQSMIRIETDGNRRLLVVESWPRWNRKDHSTDRVRKYRTKQEQGVSQTGNAFHAVSETPNETPGNAGEEKREIREKREREESETPHHETRRGNRRRPTSSLPDDFTASDEARALATAEGVDVDRELAKMRDWAIGKDERKVSWEAAFRGWLRRAGEDARRRAGAATRPGTKVQSYDPDAPWLEAARKA